MSEVSKISKLAIALVEAGMEAKAAIAFSQSDTAKDLLAESHAAPRADSPILRESPFGPVGEGAEVYDRIRADAEKRAAKAKGPDAKEVADRMARLR